MSQKSSVPQAISFVSQVLKRDIDRGYLEPKDRDDGEALAAAVTACFSDALMTA